jgi:hypothetical protein
MPAPMVHAPGCYPSFKGTIMTRESVEDAASFTAIVTAAFVVRNALVIGGIASFLIFGVFSN